MEKLYLATTFAAAIVCLLTSLLLFARRNDGERSRTILAIIILFSVFNYMTRFIDLCQGVEPRRVISVRLLLTAIFMVTSYIMYPIEVISPGYLNFRKIYRLYVPWLLLLGITIIAQISGVQFKDYNSLPDLFTGITHFESWFRLLLAFLFFMPVVSIFIIPYTRKYNNTDNVWMRKYLAIFTINTLAYVVVLSSDAIVVKIAYYFVSVSCSLAIAYMEIFERLIRKVDDGINNEVVLSNCNPEADLAGISCNKEQEDERDVPDENQSLSLLAFRIDDYITNDKLWEDPDLTAVELYRALCTNRTTFAKAMKLLGYENFTTYINTLRVKDFIKRIESGEYSSYMTAFYDAGFRSRSSAFRNFKLVTGKTPTEYFSKSMVTGHK